MGDRVTSLCVLWWLSRLVIQKTTLSDLYCMCQATGDTEKSKDVHFSHKSENCGAKRALKLIVSCFLNFMWGHTRAIFDEYEFHNLPY